MISRILAFRPATVVARLDPHSEACALSTRDLLGPAAEVGAVLPVVRAPIAAVARGALVAAKEARSALGLALPPGMTPGPWFAAVTRAADEIAAGLPFFLSAEVAVLGGSAPEVERAVAEAWRLVDAGITHLAVDVAAVAPGERGRVAGHVAEAAAERGACIDFVMQLGDGAAVSRAAAVLEDLARRGVAADVASLRCPAPADEADARRQGAALARFCQAIGGVPLVRRGPVTPALLAVLRRSPVIACEDGGAVAARAVALVPGGAPASRQDPRVRESPLERAAAGLSDDANARVESRAYVDALELIDALEARDTATALSRALELRLEERR